MKCPTGDIFRPGWAGRIGVIFDKEVAPGSEATIPGRWPEILGFDHMAPNAFLVSPDTAAADAFEILDLLFDGNPELCRARASDFADWRRLLFDWCPFGTPMKLVVRNESDKPQRMFAVLSGPVRMTEANWKIHEAECKARKAARWKLRGDAIRARQSRNSSAARTRAKRAK